MIKVINFEEKYYTEICNLVYENKHILGDDYHKLDTLPEIIKELERFKHNAFVALEDDKFLGLFYFFDTYGNKNNNHSCFICGAFKRKISPLKTREASRKFINKLYNDYDFVKIQAKTHFQNKAAIRILKDTGFKKEGWLKADTLRNGKAEDYILFGKTQSKYFKHKTR